MINSRVILFYKPYGIPSTFTDELGRETLKAYIPVEGVYSAGRLDLDSEGLLVLTDDGDLIHHLTDPIHHLPKTYLVQVEGNVNADALATLQSGVKVQDYVTRRCKVIEIPMPDLPERSKPVTPHGPTAWLRMEIEEGKKRQIRHMTAAVGLPTLRIIRISIGRLHLGELKPGEWRQLTSSEISELKDNLNKTSSSAKGTGKAGGKVTKPGRATSRGGN
jgi:23S rRNA pseudouridine2457 synthase